MAFGTGELKRPDPEGVLRLSCQSVRWEPFLSSSCFTHAVAAIPQDQVLSRLAALQTATTAELKAQWRALFGREPPAFNRPYLVSRLSYRVQELIPAREFADSDVI